MADNDPKAAPLSEELKEYALTLPTSVFPKAGNGNFFCAACGQLAFDSWKLLCCNKSICSPCHDKLQFPTQCPLCEHSPLEAELVTVNKSLRNTMRVWLDKRKKKEAKNAAKPATPPAEAAVTSDVQAPVESSETLVESLELPALSSGGAAVAEGADLVDGVGHVNTAVESAAPASKEASVTQDDAQRRMSIQTDNPAQTYDPTPATDGTNDGADNANGSGNGMYSNNTMFGMNGMAAGPGFGMNPNQGNFNNGMGWNGMNSMGAMPNMMGGAGWNNMNSMGGMFDMNNMGMPNNMFGGFGGNMGMPGMNGMSVAGGYGGGFGNNAWQGRMGGGGGYGGNFNGYNNPMGGGYNQSGFQNPQNQFPKNNFQSNRFQQRNNRASSFGNAASGPGFSQNANSRPGSRNGPVNNRDGVTPDVNAEDTAETKTDAGPIPTSGEPSNEGKINVDSVPDSAQIPSVAVDGENVGSVAREADGLTRAAEDGGAGQSSQQGLNQIQTVESVEDATPVYDQNDMALNMQPDQGYSQGMMNDFPHQMSNMNGSYGNGAGFNQGNYGPRGGYNAAYGAATVLTGEPRGLGVEGAPTGPRAMREGRPNTGFSSRANNSVRFNSHASATPAPPVQELGRASPLRKSRASPERDETLRTKDRSPTRSRSRSRSRGEDEVAEDLQVQERDEAIISRERSRTPLSEYDQDRRDDHHYRSSRHDEYEDREEPREEPREDDYDDRYRDSRDDRDDRDERSSDDSRYRSRRDKDKHRSSRSHRDRSREHRRRHRSRSPVADRYEDGDVYANGAEESSSRHKSRSDRDRYREKERDRDREKRHRRDRDYEDDYEYEKERERDRSYDRDRERKRSRRDREPEDDERDLVEEKYYASRRSRKERSGRDKDRDRDYDREKDRDERTSFKETSSGNSARAPSPPINAPTGPAAESDFSIRGLSKSRVKGPTPIVTAMPPPPSGPRSFQPPTGPRGSSKGGHQRAGSTSVPSTPTTPASAGAQDHYAAERERNIRERERLDRDRDRDRGSSTSHSRPQASSSRPSLSSKRSRDDIDREELAPSSGKSIPTGPASHRQKRRKSGEDNITNLFTAGMRKHAGASKRRGGVKVEGEVERDLEKTERERDRGRWA